MGKDIIGALRVTLGFDTNQFEHGSGRARDIAKRDMESIRKDVSTVRTAIEGLGVTMLATEVVQATRRALDYAGSIKTVAAEAGVTKKELQEYRYAASQAGIAQKDMDDALKQLTKSMGAAKEGAKDQATLLREWGIALDDANGRAYLAGEILPRIAQKLAEIEDPAERAAKGAKLFGENYQKLDALLMQGRSGIEELRKRAQSLGLVLSDDLVDGADRANKKLTDLRNTLDVNFAKAITENANSIVALADALTKAAVAAINFATNYPRVSAALVGAGAGARFGLPGAVVGGVAGFAVADIASAGSDDGNMNLAYRRQQAVASRRRVQELRNTDQAAEDYAAERGGGPARNVAVELAAAEREMQRQATLLWRAAQLQTAQLQNPAAALVGDGALPTPNPGRTRKGPKDRTEELAQRFRDELAGLYDDQLGLEQDRTTDLRERARIEHERNAAAFDAYNADVDSRVKQGELTAEQARELKLQRERNHELEKQAVNWPLDDALLAEETRISQASLDREREMLQIRASLATTARDRRAVQLELLENELRSVRLSAEEVLARHDSTEAEKALAQAKIDQLEKIRAGETLRINRETMGPLESYFDSIPKTTAEINEAYENIAANGIRNMVDGLGEAAARTIKLKGLAGQLFNQMIADLIKFQIQQAAGSASGGGGILGGLFKLAGSVLGFRAGGTSSNNPSASIPSYDDATIGMATGGDMTILGRRGIDRNVLSLNGLPIANVSYGERLSIANDNGGSRLATTVRVVKGDLFDVIVDQRAAAVAAPMAQQAESRGSIGAQVAVARQRAKSIP